MLDPDDSLLIYLPEEGFQSFSFVFKHSSLAPAVISSCPRRLFQRICLAWLGAFFSLWPRLWLIKIIRLNQPNHADQWDRADFQKKKVMSVCSANEKRAADRPLPYMGSLVICIGGVMFMYNGGLWMNFRRHKFVLFVLRTTCPSTCIIRAL